MDRVRKLIHCDGVHRRGYTGRGIGVAILDTGIYPHPDFRSRIVAFQDFCRQRSDLYDDNGHGTHIAGIIAGNGFLNRGIYRGVAPLANLIVLKVLDQSGNGNTGEVLQAIDWIVEHRRHYNIRLANISVGMLPRSKEKEQVQLLQGVERLWDSGVFTVAAAGNSGPAAGTVTIPGASGAVLTVGSSDDREMLVRKMGQHPGYSGTGPTECCICKPEILAPGTAITSCDAKEGGYTVKSGTSMATAVVTGACALALDRSPHLTPPQLKLLFYKRLATDHTTPYWGILDVERLVL